MKYCLRSAILIFFLGGVIVPGIAQNASSPFSDKSSFSIEGSSTLHNWKVEASEVSGQILLGDPFMGTELPAAGSSIEQMKVKVSVASMDGGKEVMNGKMHRALKKETHPYIQYELNAAKVTDSDGSANSIQLASVGKLTIAGVSQTLEMPVKGEYSQENGWSFSGSQTLKMSDYNIEPPTAMFGQIVTGDEVTVSFTLLVPIKN